MLYYTPRASWSDYLAGPQSMGTCFQADGHKARFLIDAGQRGDRFLDMLSRHPEAPARPAKPYGPKGWLVED